MLGTLRREKEPRILVDDPKAGVPDPAVAPQATGFQDVVEVNVSGALGGGQGVGVTHAPDGLILPFLAGVDPWGPSRSRGWAVLAAAAACEVHGPGVGSHVIKVIDFRVYGGLACSDGHSLAVDRGSEVPDHRFPRGDLVSA